MKKRLLSVVLALSILFTMLPVSVVGEEVHNGTDSSDENLTFEEFVETEKVVPSGTSVEDLELPESEQTQEEQGRDPKWEETTLDIPEMMEASLIMDDIVIPMDVSHVAQIKDVGYTNLQDAFSNVTEGDTIELLGNITLESTVTIVSGNNKSFALDLNGFTLDGVRNSAIQHSGTGTLTIKDSAGDGKITSKAYIDSNGTIDLRGGSLVVESGTIENNLNSIDANAILKDHGYNGVVIVTGGTISSLCGTAIYSGGMTSGIIIPSGTPVIKGGLRAMYPAPDLSEYEGVVIASENYDGSGPVIVYNTDDIYIYGYKYLEFGADAVIDYIPVTDIVMTNVHSVQVDTNLTLAGTVSPDTATNRAIIWSMENANGTGATINDNIFRATSSGTATVRATVANGLTANSDYTKTFDITVTAAPTTFMTEIHFKDPGFNTIQSLEKKEVKIGETLMAPDIKGYTPYMFFSYDFKFIGGTPDSYDGNSIGSIEAPASTAIIENISSSSSNKYIYIYYFETVNTISGTIKERDTNIGISGASVQLKNEAGDVIKTSSTDLNGMYTITNISGGTYSIEVSAEGFEKGILPSILVSGENLTGQDMILTKTVTFIPVTDIVMTNVHSVQVDTNLTLAGTVSPDTATNRAIIWSMENANGTGATINDNIFRATSSGTATVRATVINGLTTNSDYTKTFDITVTAAPIVTYTITPTAEIGGNISPGDSVTVNKGESQTFNIVPKRNYSICDVKVDNVSQGAISNYTFNNVTANHTISASFRYNGGSSGSGNRRPSTDDRTNVIITGPSASQPDSPGQGDLNIPGRVDSALFTDIPGHWALESIEFVVSRGLFSGTSATTFSPNSPMTRGMFVTVLGRLANVDVTIYHESSFKDVKNHAYYMGYIEWASKNNIVMGIGNNDFGPDEAISREQMAVIINNFANTMDLKLTPVHGENIFADSGKINIYAKDAVKHMQMAGILSGKDGKLFDPQATSTRAEVSAVIHRFVTLVISGVTIR